jgi:hypothetical protein
MMDEENRPIKAKSNGRNVDDKSGKKRRSLPALT